MADDDMTFETLSVKFKVVEESLQQFKQALAQTNQHIVDGNKETRGKIEKDTESSLSVIERLHELHYDKITQMGLRDKHNQIENLEQIKKAISEAKDMSVGDKFEALKDAQGQIDKLVEGVEKLKGHFGGLRNIIKEIEDSLHVSVNSIFSMTALVTGLMAVEDRSNQIEHGTLIAGSNRGRELSVDETNLYSDWFNQTLKANSGVSPTEAKKVGETFMRAEPNLLKMSDVTGKNGLANQALFAAPAMGISTDKALMHMGDMMEVLRMNSGEVSTEFQKLMKTAQQLNDVTGKSVETTMSLAKNFSAYNLDVDSASKIVKGFWEEIRNGKLAMEDLNKILNMGQTTTEGQRAFIGSEILSKDSNLSKYFEGHDKVAGSEIAKRLMTGIPLYGEHFDTTKQRDDVVNHRRSEAITDIFREAQNRAKAVSNDPASQQFFAQKFLQSFTGINLGNLSSDEGEKLMHAIDKGGLLDPKILEKSMRDQSVEQLIEIGKKLDKLNVSPLEQIMNQVKDILQTISGSIAFLAGEILSYTGNEAVGDKMINVGRSMLKGTQLGAAIDEGMEGMSEDTSDLMKSGAAGFSSTALFDKMLKGHTYGSLEEAKKDLQRFYDSERMAGVSKISLENHAFLNRGLEKTAGGRFEFVFELSDGTQLGSYVHEPEAGTSSKTTIPKSALIKHPGNHHAPRHK